MQVNPSRPLILQARLEKEVEPVLPLARRPGYLDNFASFGALDHPHQSANQLLLATGQSRPPQIVNIRIHFM